jgi:hypothetical protein
MGVSIPGTLLDNDKVAALYPVGNVCLGYCKDQTYRRIAILAALDNVVVQGKPGSELLPEYNGRGVK